MKRVLLRADDRPIDRETARLLELELACRHVGVTYDVTADDLGVAVFVSSYPSAELLAEMEEFSQSRKRPTLCCCRESEEPLPVGVIRVDRPFPVGRFCDSLAQTVKEGKNDIVLSHSGKELSLNHQTGTVTVGSHTVSLTKKEAALLSLLLEKRGTPVSREEALYGVWGSDTVEDSNVVDVYIRYLRRKLDEQLDTRLIRTVRGQGYMIK